MPPVSPVEYSYSIPAWGHHEKKTSRFDVALRFYYLVRLRLFLNHEGRNGISEKPDKVVVDVDVMMCISHSVNSASAVYPPLARSAYMIFSDFV